MTEWEIIKESKQAWELLNDLHDNSQIATDGQRLNIRLCMNDLALIYANAWQMMSENTKDCELLKTDGFVRCPRCNNKLYISDLIGYAYLCPNCDENMYYTECEVEKVWWNE